MQTRRDQLHAYRFQNRRALAALVTGDPNVVEAPMRRLTITTVSGIMIAVLVTVGFTLYGFIRPSAGDSWKEAGSIISEDETSTTYVYLDGVLHPVANYTSAVLALGGQDAHIVRVERSDLKDAKRGDQIGILGLPTTLPSSGDLVTSPVTVCSRQRASAGDDSLVTKVNVDLGSDDGSRALGRRTAVVVDTGAGSRAYVLYDGHRLAVANGSVANSLGLADRRRLQVGRAFLDAVPPGTPLAPPTIDGQGDPARLDGVTAVVGQLLRTSNGDQYVAMPDGVAQVNDVQAALLQALPIGPGNTVLDPVSAPQSTAGLPTSKLWTAVSARLTGLPDDIPSFDTTAVGNGGICAVFRGGDRPVFAVPPDSLPTFTPSGITESAASRQGTADTVTVPPGGAAVLKSADGSATVFLVGDTGKKFAAAPVDVLGGFGYDAGKATPLPAALLTLIPSGPALSQAGALKPVN